jgi:hypothetical protein
LESRLQTGDGSVRPAQVDAHQPGKDHPDQGGDQGQSVILFADDLMVETEDVLPMKLVGGAWCTACADMSCIDPHLREFLLPHAMKRVARSIPLLQCRFFFHPVIVESPTGTTRRDTPSCCNAQAAKLRTDDLVLADLGRREMQRHIQSGNKILLHPQFRNEERMPHVFVNA